MTIEAWVETIFECDHRDDRGHKACSVEAKASPPMFPYRWTAEVSNAKGVVYYFCPEHTVTTKKEKDAVAAEREACARVADDRHGFYEGDLAMVNDENMRADALARMGTAYQIALAIRARGQSTDGK